MSTTTLDKPAAAPPKVEQPKRGEPVWALAEMLYPLQGEWTERAYLNLDLRGTELVEGFLEFKPMPTDEHHAITGFFYRLLFTLLEATNGGLVRFAGVRVRTTGSSFREPDVMALLPENRSARENAAWKSADIAIEIVSPDDPARDYEKKRTEYAAAGIREYWIVDPAQRHIVLLTLDQGQTTYREVGTYRGNDEAKSPLIEGFNVRPADVWAAVQTD